MSGSMVWVPAVNRVGTYDDRRDKFVRELPKAMYVPVRRTP